MSLKSLAALVFLVLIGILASVRGYLAADRVVHARGEDSPQTAIDCASVPAVESQSVLNVAGTSAPAASSGQSAAADGCESDRKASKQGETEATTVTAAATDAFTPCLRTSDAPRRTGLLTQFARRWRAEYSAAAAAEVATQPPSLPASSFSGS